MLVSPFMTVGASRPMQSNSDAKMCTV